MRPLSHHCMVHFRECLKDVEVRTKQSYPRPHPVETLSTIRKVGVSPEAIRLSVGIEDIEDILEDLDQALGARR